MTTTMKINVDKASLKALFKTIAKINDALNEILFLHGTTGEALIADKSASTSCRILYA